jgi:hypothetical protein
MPASISLGALRRPGKTRRLPAVARQEHTCGHLLSRGQPGTPPHVCGVNFISGPRWPRNKSCLSVRTFGASRETRPPWRRYTAQGRPPQVASPERRNETKSRDPEPSQGRKGKPGAARKKTTSTRSSAGQRPSPTSVFESRRQEVSLMYLSSRRTM